MKKKNSIRIIMMSALILTGCGVDEGWDDEPMVEVKAALSTTNPDGLNYCGDGSFGTVRNRLYRKKGNIYTQIAVCAYGCAVNQANVSSECLLAGPWPSDALAVKASMASGPAKPSVVTASPAATWITDANGGTEQDIRDAAAIYRQWRLLNPSLKSGAQPPSTVRVAMVAKIARTCAKSTSQGQVVDRIIARYAGALPTTDQGVLDFIGTRAQCKETVDRLVREVGLTSQSYANYLANGRVMKYSAIRAGNIAIMNDNAHVAIVVAVNRDSNGNLLNLTLAESNWSSDFGCPMGQIPWLRTITTKRIIPLSQINVGSSGAYKIAEVKF